MTFECINQLAIVMELIHKFCGCWILGVMKSRVDGHEPVVGHELREMKRGTIKHVNWSCTPPLLKVCLAIETSHEETTPKPYVERREINSITLNMIVC